MNADALIRDSRRTVLVVEDEAVNRELLGFILRERYEVLFAENGREALEIIRERLSRLSMVLLDINMPLMNGFELLKIMQGDEGMKRIPVIVLTSDRGSELETLRLGAVDFIPKPYDMPEIILARVDRIIRFTEDRQIINDVELDPLTGLYNRNFFLEYCGRLRTAAPERPMDMLAVDIDRFRMVNEVYGKRFGDEVLKALAGSIREALRASYGIACRCDADLFYIYTAHMESHDAFYAAIAEPVRALGERNSIRLRMGVIAGVDGKRDIRWYSDAAKSACAALRGRHERSIQVYDQKMYERELYRERLMAEMEPAFRQKQFRVFFQPKYDVTGDAPRLCGAEALVRWVHPELGFIRPGDFIPLFEENGLITRLDDYIWREAAAMIRRWRAKYGCAVPVSVNLSRMDLFDPTLIRRLMSIAADYGIDRDLLRLEVTESAYSESVGRMLEAVERLRDLGFKVEMDDFGSGYSSLNMLCVMPVDTLKIDMKFVRNLTAVGDLARRDEAPDAAAMGFHMLELVIEIAHNLRLPAVIEGVETREQYELVKRAGCDIVQGYYFSRPVDEDAFEEILAGSAEAESSGSGAETPGR